MPIYEYACKKCGEFETVQKITDPPLAKCPTCAGRVSKLISSTSFQLKGSGWYVTDYARKDSGKTKEQAGEAKADAKSEAKSETSGSSDKVSSRSSTQAAAA